MLRGSVAGLADHYQGSQHTRGGVRIQVRTGQQPAKRDCCAQGGQLPSRPLLQSPAQHIHGAICGPQSTHLCTELCPRTILPEAGLINALPSTLSARLLRWPGKAQKCATSPGLLQHER